MEPHATTTGTPAPHARRRVYYEGTGYIECALYRRESLASGHELAGPAIVEQPDTTTVILPECRACVDAYDHVVIVVGTV